jgi:hypothetical protein
MFSLKEARKKTIDGLGAKYIERLQAGETVQVRPRGNSMRGKIESGQFCTVAPNATANSRSATIVVAQRLGGGPVLFGLLVEVAD